MNWQGQMLLFYGEGRASVRPSFEAFEEAAT
jgi:hypothetical protein